MKFIEGCEGRYSVTKSGKVWSHIKYGGTPGRWLSQTPNQNGYLCVCMVKDGKRISPRVHKLVSDAYLPKNGKPHINHKNGIKTDNRLKNLERVTALENTRHAIKLGLRVKTEKSRLASKIWMTKYNHSQRSLTMFQAKKIRVLCKSGIARKELAKKYKVSVGIIKCIVTNITYVSESAQ